MLRDVTATAAVAVKFDQISEEGLGCSTVLDGGGTK